MTDDARHQTGTYQSYHAEYCESCGTLVSASDKIVANTREPVHRIDIQQAIGEFDEVCETTAIESGGCDRCGGQLVKRYYAYPVSEAPDEVGIETPDVDDEEQYKGRHPDDDALIAWTPDPDPEDWQEVSEIPGLHGRDEDG